ncbi:MAG: tetratricopeptide repeat protein [Paracoccaceae bacterium]
MRRIALSLTMAIALGTLAGCQSSEEKAEGHYRSGLELLTAGDTDRALVEFRNVFKLNGQHREARQTYARVQREKGNLREAYGQYLRLVEQYPDDFEGNVALAEMAIRNGAWDEAETYARRAATVQPDDTTARSLVLVLEYRTALTARDQEGMDTALTAAQTLLTAQPDLSLLRQLLADERLRNGDAEEALALIDEGLARDPSLEAFYTMRLGILYQLGRSDEIASHLQAMIARNPDDADTRNMLISWYVSQNDIDAAEATLRQEINPAEDALEPRIRMITFLTQTRGPEAARTETRALIAANPDSPHVALYRSILANFEFEDGNKDSAIAEMQKIIADFPQAAQISAIKITLAQMLAQTGNQVGARALIEEVLAADPTEVAALKLKAGWLIDDDKTGDALIVLRTALGQAPRDAETMTLMARAHERDGSTDLMGEMLALAVESSGQAPAESLRYAAFLMQQDKKMPAEDILLNALRRDPENAQLLGALGRLYLDLQDWGRAEHIVRTLLGAKTEIARRLGQELQARLLATRGQNDELTRYLEELAKSETSAGASASVEMALVRDAIRRGEIAKALEQAAKLDGLYPDLPQAGLLHALVMKSSGQTAEPLARLQALTMDHPDFEQAWVALYNIQLAEGALSDADATLTAALAAAPDSRTLQWVKASAFERAGDVDGAIRQYETLYAKYSDWAIVANNLASLLSTTKTDAESLDRAYVIARRLRGTTVPAFQDTYGWIALRRGNLEDALTHLEPAAKGLPTDMSVQYHLAMVYAALDRRDEALAILRKVQEAVPNPAPALLESVRAEITRLESLPPAGNN